MSAPWCWRRRFGWKETATWGWPKIEIDLEVTFRLCNQMTVSQREQTTTQVNRFPGSGLCRAARPVASSRKDTATCCVTGGPLV